MTISEIEQYVKDEFGIEVTAKLKAGWCTLSFLDTKHERQFVGFRLTGFGIPDDSETQKQAIEQAARAIQQHLQA